MIDNLQQSPNIGTASNAVIVAYIQLKYNDTTYVFKTVLSYALFWYNKEL